MTLSLPLEVSKTRKPPFSETRSFPGKYESLERIGDFVRNVAEDAGFQKFAMYSIEMAVDEACSNIIEHAYGGEGKGTIHCTCTANDSNLIIVLRDRGKPFDPSNVSQPNLSKELDDREAHGLGLFFIRQWMDEVSFTSKGSENILTMVKRK
jgi:serine/threonine-protein kinase RsbW